MLEENGGFHGRMLAFCCRFGLISMVGLVGA